MHSILTDVAPTGTLTLLAPVAVTNWVTGENARADLVNFGSMKPDETRRDRVNLDVGI
jgi:hypothetical protein